MLRALIGHSVNPQYPPITPLPAMTLPKLASIGHWASLQLSSTPQQTALLPPRRVARVTTLLSIGSSSAIHTLSGA
jgi:hypothetical protein